MPESVSTHKSPAKGSVSATQVELAALRVQVPCSADGLIVEFRVKQVQGHRVAGFVSEDDFSSLRVVEVVRELGLITCERGEFGQGARLLS